MAVAKTTKKPIVTEKQKVARVDAVQICTMCGNYATRSTLERLFYKSYSKYHAEKQRVHICKECVTSNSLIGNELSMEKFVEVLRHIDKPYIPSVLESSIKEVMDARMKNGEEMTRNTAIYSYGSEVIGCYMKNITMPHFAGYTFINGLQSIEPEETTDKRVFEEYNLTELQEKYGYGYEPEEYYNFERKYKKISLGYTEKTALHTERLLSYIRNKVKEEMASARGEVVLAEKWSKMASTDATAAKLNVSQLSKSDITGGIDLIPQLAEAVEEYLSLIPLLPKVKEIPYDDADMIIWAFTNYIRRLDGKEEVTYKEVYKFYDEFLENYFINEKKLSMVEVEEEKKKRNNVFRDLGEKYFEPVYESDRMDAEEGDEE